MRFNYIFYFCYEDKAKMRRFSACCALACMETWVLLRQNL